MSQIKKDLKALQDSNKELDVKAEMGYKYKDMYTEDYLEFLQNLCDKYNVAFNQSEIDWEWCNYIQNKQSELENTIKQSSEYIVSNDEIIANMTAYEKFKIICRIKNIDINDVGEEIYKIIENSAFEEKSEYIGVYAYEDESMEISDEYCLYIDTYMLNTKDDWIRTHMQDYENLSYEEAELMDWELYVFGDEFNDKQKEFIRLALQCGVDQIVLKYVGM